jgi:spore coat protein U-like protein
MRTLLIAAACAASLVAVSSTGAADGQLVGSVGPGYTISLKDSSGAAVKHLDAGTYTLLVHDLSAEHDFHLSGPGVEVLTDVEFVGDKTFTITVSNGTYNFVCDPHSSRMHGLFTGGTTPAPPAKALTLRVGPGRTLAVPAARLSAGRYAISAKDASATDNIHLKGADVDRKTGVAFKGQARWAVTLKAGTYRVFSDAHRMLTRTIRIS